MAVVLIDLSEFLIQILKIWPKIKQFLSNCPASDWTFSCKTGIYLHNRVKMNYKTKQPLCNF